MALVEVKEPLVFFNEELCWFVLKSTEFPSPPDFHIILMDLSEQVLQALKGFFLLLKQQKPTTRAASLCLTVDFSKVVQEKCVDVYKSLLQNIGPEVTELRLSGMEKLNYYIHPFAVANPVLLSTSSFPNLHTIRISNLGGNENIMWLSYFLNAAKNLRQLHLGPFEDVYVQGLGKWEKDGYELLAPSAKYGSKNEIRLEQLKLLGQCTNFEGMRQAQLFIKGLSISTFNPRSFPPLVRKNWDGKGEAEIGVGIPIPMIIQIEVSEHEKCDDIMVNNLCSTPSLIVLSGLGFYSPEPKLPSSSQQLAKLELESTPTWLLENLEKFPSLKHLVWRPLWSSPIKYRQNYGDCYSDDDYGYVVSAVHMDKRVLLEQQILTSLQQIKLLTDQKPEVVNQRHSTLEIFQIVQDWSTSQSLPPTAFQIIKLFSSNFPSLKILSCEVGESAQVSALLQLFPQVKEFHFKKYVPITEIRANPMAGLLVSYKLENFRQTMAAFKTEVEQHQNLCFKDTERPTVKIGAFIFDESMKLFCNRQLHENIEMNVPEIVWAISNLKLSMIVIPLQVQYEAFPILEAIKSAEPKNLEHVHFQITRNLHDPNSYQGIPQHIVESYQPYFLVTNDFEPGKNNLSCSSLASC